MEKQEVMKRVYDQIGRIVSRAKLNRLIDVHNQMLLSMDLEVCYEKENLCLDTLEQSNDLNFAHDIVGILKNMDRENKVLTNCFVPRATNCLEKEIDEISVNAYKSTYPKAPNSYAGSGDYFSERHQVVNEILANAHSISVDTTNLNSEQTKILSDMLKESGYRFKDFVCSVYIFVQR